MTAQLLDGRSIAGEVEREAAADAAAVPHRDGVSGTRPQQPMPAQIDPRTVFERIDPRKDVDGLGPANMAALLVGRPILVPCTPAGIMLLLQRAGGNPMGKEAVVVGRSIIGGRPGALLLLH